MALKRIHKVSCREEFGQSPMFGDVLSLPGVA